MEIAYPIFVRAKDDLMVEMIESPRDLGRYDYIDVEDGLFAGWDVNGVPFQLRIDEGKTSVRAISYERREPQELRKAILQDAQLARPESPFDESGTEGDVVQLYRAVRAHIRQGRFRRWVRRKFRR